MMHTFSTGSISAHSNHTNLLQYALIRSQFSCCANWREWANWSRVLLIARIHSASSASSSTPPTMTSSSVAAGRIISRLWWRWVSNTISQCIGMNVTVTIIFTTVRMLVMILFLLLSLRRSGTCDERMPWSPLLLALTPAGTPSISRSSISFVYQLCVTVMVLFITENMLVHYVRRSCIVIMKNMTSQLSGFGDPMRQLDTGRRCADLGLHV